MTEQEYKELKKVLADAPEGATHFALGMHYLALNASNNWMRYDPNGFKNAKWFVADDFKFSYVKSFHSLSDLRTMVEQYEENERLKAKVAELEKEVADHKANIDHLMNNCHRFTDKRLQEHNLEQQAKGVEDAVSSLERPDAPLTPTFILNYDLRDYAKKLREKSKGGDV